MPLSLSLSLSRHKGSITRLKTYHYVHLTGKSFSVLKDVYIQVVEFVIPYDFVILDIDESFQVPIILWRRFQATLGAVIDVSVGKQSF